LGLSASGAVVEVPGPYGQRVGLKPGDILERINGAQITTASEAESALAARSGTLMMQIKRGLKRLRLRFRL
jgi:type II secretory pathway component PulC